MDIERAKQIIHSQKVTQILYHGSPIWIESIKDNNLAEVVDLDSRNVIEVPIVQLVENNPDDI